MEGTEADLVEVLGFEAGKVPAYENKAEQERKVGDIHEIVNHRTAIQHAETQLEKLPLSGRLLRNAHAELLKGVRGRHRAPGQYRKTQNWIGPPGCRLEEARFVPIPVNDLAEGIARWERYVNSQQDDTLVQLAVTHVEFEALHPFLDGNGRLGRMLIPLFLYQKKLLSSLTFYVSEYLEANREEYIERLLAVSREDDWTGWCVFFLRAIMAQAGSNTKKAGEILTLYESKKQWIADATRSQFSIRALTSSSPTPFSVLPTSSRSRGFLNSQPSEL